MKTLRFLVLAILPWVWVGVLADPTALDRYVAKPDDHYGYLRYHTERKPLYNTYFFRMTSQQWRSPDQVDRYLWQHDVAITVPRLLTAKNRHLAVLIIDGGNNDSPPPKDTNEQAATLALALGCPVVLLKQIPNQPLVFADEQPPGRSEDAILAYTFDKFLQNPADEEWPAHLPMTKAVVRAMDMAQRALAARSIRIRKFILYGGSKRGWTAWLTAAVDSRVKAIVPASADLLRLPEQNQHTCEAYGFYPKALEDYVAFDIPNRSRTAEGAALAAVVDPYSYRDRYKIPKLVLNAAGDQYFLPDSSQFYFRDLPKRKWLRYSPNTDHAQNNDAFLSGAAWAKKILNGQRLPRFRWSFDELAGAIDLRTIDRPSQVRLWRASNPDARDFRLETIGPSWVSSPLYDLGDGRFVGPVASPERGWSAYFVELTYKSSSFLEPDQVYTTDVYVTPDVLPYVGQPCAGE